MRKAFDVDPVQHLKARTNADDSENPTRYAVSLTGSHARVEIVERHSVAQIIVDLREAGPFVTQASKEGLAAHAHFARDRFHRELAATEYRRRLESLMNALMQVEPGMRLVRSAMPDGVGTGIA